MSALTFREAMSGFVTLGQPDCVQGSRIGRERHTALEHHLTIRIADLDAFIADPGHLARATGWVDCLELGGRLDVQAGWFNLLVGDPGDPRGRRMEYRLHLIDGEGNPLTLSGVKVVSDGDGLDVWSDTTTLFVRLWAGHLDPEAEVGSAQAEVLGAGLLHISPVQLVRMTASFRATGRPWKRPAAIARFGRLFLGELWAVYHARAAEADDDFPEARRADPPELAALRARGLLCDVVAFRAGDGVPLDLHRIRRPDGTAPRGPVLLVAGAGVRATAFYGQPAAETIVDRLLAEGYDVWIENWRASIDLARRHYDLDQAAVFDHPQAVRTVLEATGVRSLPALAHCAGASSLMLSSAAGLVDELRSIVVNGTALHPVVTRRSARKLRWLVPIAARLYGGIDPQWGERAPTLKAKGITRWARLVRRECDNPVCKLSNYAYGAGPDIMWRHENLDAATHEWVSREFGWTPYSFFDQMRRSVRRGRLIPVSGLTALPEDLADRPQTPAAVTFVVGELNGCYRPEGQRRSHAVYDALEPGRHHLEVLPGYGHFDVLFGKDAPRDTFDVLVAGLDRR